MEAVARDRWTRGLARATLVLIGLSAAVALAWLAVRFHLEAHAADAMGQEERRAFETHRQTFNAMAPYPTVLFVVTAIVYFVWFTRALRLARSRRGISARAPLPTGAWSVGAYFVPLVNFWTPLGHLRGLFAWSDPGLVIVPEDPTQEERAGYRVSARAKADEATWPRWNPLVVWWTLWLVRAPLIAAQYALSLGANKLSASATRAVDMLSRAVGVLMFFQFVLGFAVVWVISRRQWIQGERVEIARQRAPFAASDEMPRDGEQTRQKRRRSAPKPPESD